MKQARVTRVNEEVKREIVDIIRNDMKDRRIGSIVSVTRVAVTSDLSWCKAYISVLGDENAKNETLAALKSAAGFVRNRLAARVNLRKTPELLFFLDDTLDYSLRLNELIDSVNKGDTPNA
jgi:ribosome-binding factor A